MWGAAKIENSESGGRALTRFGRADDFMVGVDNSFVKLASALKQRTRGETPAVDDIDTNILINLDILGTTHLVDCSPDAPSDYRFLQYGNRIAIHDGREYSGRRLRDAEWSLVRKMAERDYSFVKTNKVATLSQVELLWHGREFVYRRFIIPLSSDGREVSHLLVATRPNLLKVVPSAFD
jgi:hypothetical protein